jgi:hypothetical protein
MKKILTLLRLVGSLWTYGQNITRIEYFFDKDPGYNNGIGLSFTTASVVSNLNVSANITTLTGGVHVLYVRSKDANAVWSQVASQAFVKFGSAVAPNITRIEYFFDQDPGYGKATAVSFTTNTVVSNVNVAADLTTLTSGVHVLYVRSLDAQGNWSQIASQAFVKFGSAVQGNITYIEYFFDNDPGFGNGVSVPFTPSITVAGLNIVADITPLSVGGHRLFARSRDVTGSWSLVANRNFTKTGPPSIVINGLNSGFYAFAGSVSRPQSITVTASNLNSPVITLSGNGHIEFSAVCCSGFVDNYVLTISGGTGNLILNARFKPTVSGIVVNTISAICLDGTFNKAVNTNAELVNGGITSIAVGTITTCSTLLISPNHPALYSNNTDVTMTIYPTAPGLKLSATFNSFVSDWDGSSYPPQDELYLYNGTNNTGTLTEYYGYYSNQPSNQTATGTAGALTFRLRTNSSGVFEGFGIGIGCVGTATLQSQTITLNPISNVTLSGANQNVTISGSASSGLAVSYSIASNPSGIASLNGNVITLSNVGTVTVTGNQAGNSSYLAASPVSTVFSVSTSVGITTTTSPLTQTITFGTLSNVTLSGTSQIINLSATASSGLVVSYTLTTNPAGIASLSNNQLTVNNVGTVNVTASQSGNSAYLAASSITKSFSVVTVTSGTPSTSTGTNLATISGLQISNSLNNTANSIKVTISGTNINAGATATVGGVALTNVSVIGTNALVGTIPAGSTVTNPSNPSVAVQNAGTVASTSTIVTPTVTDVLESVLEKAFTLYPNPNKGSFTVSSTSVTSFKIYSLEGALLQTGSLTEGENTITSKLGSGFYIFKAGNVSKKLLVE